MSYPTAISELDQEVSIFWPSEFSKRAFARDIFPLLVETQASFAAILGIPVPDIDTFFDLLNATLLPSNLFLLHLVVLTDFGGEMWKRVNRSCSVLFPAGTMEYKWGEEHRVYKFRTMPISSATRPVLLHIDGNALVKKINMSDLAQDVIALLLFGGTCTNERVAAMLEKCILGQYIGDPARVREHVRQQTLNLHRFEVLASMFSEGERAL